MTSVEFILYILHHQTFPFGFLRTRTNCLKRFLDGSACIMKINHDSRSGFEGYCSFLKCVHCGPHYDQQAAEYEDGGG